MKPTLQLLAVFLTAILTGCASTGSYFADRSHDAADVFSLAFGKGIGLKGRAGPVTTGLMMDYTAVGLRGGEICHEDLSEIETNYDTRGARDGVMIIHSAERFTLTRSDRGKNFTASSRTGDIVLPFITTLDTESSPAYYTEIEAVVAAYYSIRIAFNPGELLDFVLGWTTLDIFGDDIGRKRENRTSP